MNEFIVENQGINTFLVYHFQPDDQIDTFSYGMITNNKIPGIIPTILTQINEDRCFKFNISSRISLEQFFNGVVNKNGFVSIFLSIANAILASEEYMLDPSCFLLDPKNIYVNVGTREAEIVCFPIVRNEPQIELVQFFKNIVFQTQFDPTENADYVAKIISFLNGSYNFSLVDFKKLLDSLMLSNNGIVQNVATAQPVAPAPQQVQSKPVQAVQPQAAVQPKPQSMPAPQPIRQGQGATIGGSIPPVMPGKTNGMPVKMEVPSTGTIPSPAGNGVEIPGGGQLPVHLENSGKSEKKKSLFGGIFGGGKGSKKDHSSKSGKKDKKNTSAPATFNVPGMENSGSATAVPGGGNAPGKAPIPPIQPVNGAVKQSVPPIQPIRPQAVPVQPQPMQPQAMPIQPQPMASPVRQQPMANMMPNVSSETTVLNAGPAGETTVLSEFGNSGQINAMSAYIIRQSTNERVMIRKPVFKLGKEQSFVDYCIMNNPTVSRSHANILRKGDDYFIIDMNSKNHTYVNGTMIPSGQEIKLEHGSQIALSNEYFEFYLH